MLHVNRHIIFIGKELDWDFVYLADLLGDESGLNGLRVFLIYQFETVVTENELLN